MCVFLLVVFPIGFFSSLSPSDISLKNGERKKGRGIIEDFLLGSDHDVAAGYLV